MANPSTLAIVNPKWYSKAVSNTVVRINMESNKNKFDVSPQISNIKTWKQTHTNSLSLADLKLTQA